MQTTPVPDAADVLLYDPAFMTTESPDGLWLCTDVDDVAAIQINAATPLETSPDSLRRAGAFFEAFPFVLVVGADPHRREALADTLRQALPGLEICLTEQEGYRGCTSVAELKANYGLSAVDGLALCQRELPPWGLLEVSSVEPVDLARLPRTSSGIPALDALVGGFYAGELSVWTGRRKEGKSTLLGLPILAALRSGGRVCVYSGELPAWRYKAWLQCMAAGPEHLQLTTTDAGRQVWAPRPEIAAQIDLWWKDRLFLVDNLAQDIHRPEKLLAVFRYCRKRYDCRTYVVDNLMTVSLPGEDLYRAQGRFVGQLTDFAHEAEAHVHLVAHRRKGQGRGEADDISGSAEITNRADNVFAVSRESILDGTKDATLSVLSNRDFGASGDIPLRFDGPSRRFYWKNPRWPAGWEK